MPNKDTNLTLRVGRSLQERRLDKYLHGRYSNYSRVMLQEVIKAGGVKVNGKKAKPSLKLNPDDLIEISLPELPTTEIPPEDIPLNILHEDNDIIISTEIVPYLDIFSSNIFENSGSLSNSNNGPGIL